MRARPSAAFSSAEGIPPSGSSGSLKMRASEGSCRVACIEKRGGSGQASWACRAGDKERGQRKSEHSDLELEIHVFLLFSLESTQCIPVLAISETFF